MILFVNTADLSNVFIGFSDDKKFVLKKQFVAKAKQAETLLPGIDQMLKKLKIKMEELEGVVVVSGPGPFTALRIGIVTANTLAWAFNLPIYGIKLSDFNDLSQLVTKSYLGLKKSKPKSIIEPFYGRGPNITKKKK